MGVTFTLFGASCVKEESQPAHSAATVQPTEQSHHAHSETHGPNVTKAVAVLVPTDGNDVRGVVLFEKLEKGIRVVADIQNLTPGDHGFHVHEFGDCSAPDATSAGGHFNPGGHDHGGPNSDVRHVGDLGNVTANESGVAHLEHTDNMLSFSGENSVLGRGLIVHEVHDDLTSQPTGAAGARVACGVIGVANQ